jgi:MoxR-like ATPase
MDTANITELSTHTPAQKTQERFRQLQEALSTRILGQNDLVEKILIALLADGHMLVEGAPGLAKTTAVKELATRLEGNFARIQFTPDLLPADLTGTEVYRPQTGEFDFQPGPLFHNLVLADEINRAPAKVQSALLEAMGERQITVGRQSYPLPKLFLVMATQNPIEQEGTYPLPEAQLDRFLLHINIGYPEAATEHAILRLVRDEEDSTPPASDFRLGQNEIFTARQAIRSMYLAETLEEYLVQLVLATRNPAHYGDDLSNVIEYGASPRGTIALERTARARAWLQGREYVDPEDVQAMAVDVLRHRIGLTYAAESAGMTRENFIRTLLQRVPLT